METPPFKDIKTQPIVTGRLGPIQEDEMRAADEVIFKDYGLTPEDNMPSRADEDQRNAARNRRIMGGEVRVAKVTGGADSLAMVKGFLPSNYGAVTVFGPGTETILIVGYDNAGWTLDGYVLPRLASGLIWAEEIK